MTTPLASAFPRKRRRRWFQFGISSLLVFTTLFALALGWWIAPFEREIEPDVGYFVGYLDHNVPDPAEAERAFDERRRNLREVCTFRRDLWGKPIKHGVATLWDAEGNKVRERHWSWGRLHGKEVGWNSSGQKVLEAEYRRGTAHGTWTHFGPDGTRLSVYEYRDGGLLRQTDFLSDGKVVRDYGTPQQSVDGPCVETRFDLAGNKIEQIAFRDGSTRHGPATGWYPAGEMRYRGAWKDGREQGQWAWWRPNGDSYALATFDQGALIIGGDGERQPKTPGRRLSYRVLSRRSLDAFYRPLDIEFEATPLVDVLAFFQDLFEMPMRIDEESLKSANTSSEDLSVSCDIRDTAPVTALQQILESVGLTFFVDQQGLLVIDERFPSDEANTIHPEAIPSQALAATLGAPVDLRWVDTPLSEVVAQLKEHYGLDVRLDEGPTVDAAATLEMRVTASISGTSLHAALVVMLNELGLSYRIKDNVLLITAVDQEEQQ